MASTVEEISIEEAAGKAERAISEYHKWRLVYADGVKLEAEYEADRCMHRRSAILRLMSGTNPLTGNPHSASSAEKIVEADEEYSGYLSQQRQVVLSKNRAHAEAESFWLQAELYISLVKSSAGLR